MATKDDIKRLKHKEKCTKLRNGIDCEQCGEYGYKYWRCDKCQVVGYTQGIESHTCPGKSKEFKTHGRKSKN